jgi:transcriptional regulator with XRE-family HTH domain
MNISENIKQIRESKRLSQAEVSRRLNLDPPSYFRFEKRGSKLSLEQIENIANALEVSVREVLGFGVETTDKSEIEILENDILKKENKEQSEKIEALEDYSKRLKKDLDFFKILFTESGFAVIIILPAIFNISKLLKEKVEATKNLDAVTDLKLSNDIYREFKGVLEFGQFNEFGLKDESINSVIDTPISVLDMVVNSDNILKMTLKDDNISLFRKEYFRFLDRYEKEKKENKK